jgi:poly-gamma-glutamate synthesis protein (capsule biosynthesis protein)
VPIELQFALEPLVAAGRLTRVMTPEEAQISLTSLPPNTPSPLTARWVYAPVVPFATVADNIALADIQRYWAGDTNALAYLNDARQPPSFATTAPVFFWLTQILGAPARTVPVEVVGPEAVGPTLTARRAAWGVVPFQNLDASLKVLALDGINVLDKNLPSERYPLGETFGLTGDPTLVNEAANLIRTQGRWINTNRDTSRMTTLIMTGVTALTRATAYQMEIGGITTPLRDIAPFLADGDIIHTSNEVSFTKDCPYPNPSSRDLVFCSRETYFGLLAAMRLNLVELTGNHVNDYGTGPLINSLNIYNQWSIPYFGGGRNREDARKAAILQHNGNTLAFLGCNPVGPPGAWATDARPGAAQCDDAFLSQEIPRLRGVADLVVMTIQYQEFYRYDAPPQQVAFFRKYAQMGAGLVMGSQAHQPQGFAFVDGAFIHFGIGNLFFDQMWSLGTRQMFADKLIIYDGRHISTILFTGLIEDYSRPRPMTERERAAFLRTIFKASGW